MELRCGLASTQVRTRFYFEKGKTGSIASLNDGALSAGSPEQIGASDSYKVVPDVSAFGGAFNRMGRKWDGDMSVDVDRYGLTYTTPPLANDTEITGHPLVHLWVTSTARDGNFIVWIEDIGGDDKSSFVTDGAMRGSHRKLTKQQPWDDMGLPYHASIAAESLPLPQIDPVELEFGLYPISYVFKHGHRIRVTITGAEKNAYQQPPGFDNANPPTIRVYRGGGHASYVEFPVIPPGSKFFTGSAKVTRPNLNYTGPSQLYLGSDRAFLRLGNYWLRCIKRDARRVAELPSDLVCESEAGALTVRVRKDKDKGTRVAVAGSDVSFEGAIR